MSQRGTYAYKFCVCDFVTSLTNTLTEIGHSHVLDRIYFESITALGVECEQTTICLKWLTILTEERAAWKTICCAFVIFH